MALNIKDPETDRLVRELAAATGESITVATRRAVEDRLERVGRRPTPSSGLAAIITRGRSRPMLDHRCEAEILGYDAEGLPA
jgi:antitoxin VapB